MATYGRFASTPSSPSSGVILAGRVRASTYGVMTENGWGWRVGGHVGKNTSVVSEIRYGVWKTSAGSPGDRMGYTAEVNATTLMTSGSEGGLVTANFVETTFEFSPIDTAIKMTSGQRYAIGVLPQVANLGHGQIDAGDISQAYENFYEDFGVSLPPHPFTVDSVSVEGWMTLWVEYDPNEAPVVVVNRTPSGTITTTTPTFEGDFRDRNGTWGPGNGGADRGDYMKQYGIELRQVGLTSLKWNLTQTASNSEQNADRFSIAYGGSALTAGTAYEWRTRTSDQFGAWGEWSSWLQFTPATEGIVTLDGTPTGKQEAITGLTFQGRWHSLSGLSMNVVKVRLLQDGVIVASTGNITKSAASSALPGTLFSVTQAETGFILTWGQSYTYQMSGRDTNSVFSDWSNVRSFNTNAKPNTPTNLAPSNSQAATSLPLLTFTMTDADDSVATGLTASVRIKNSAGALLFTRTATYNATLSRWEYQTTGTDLATFATYKWDAKGNDGTVDGDFSSEAVFIYSTGPVVTVTSPTEAQVIGTNTPTVTWTVTDQQKLRVRIWLSDAVTLIYDSTQITSTVNSHIIPSGNLHNGVSYTMTVEVENSAAQVGTSSNRTFSVDLGAVEQVTNLVISGEYLRFDAVASAVLLSWDETNYPPSEFDHYDVYRRESGQAEALALYLGQLTSPAQTTFLDTNPASGVEYTYSVRQSIRAGTDTLESEPVEGSYALTLKHTVVSAADDGDGYRSVIKYWSARGFEHVTDGTEVLPWGATRPTVLFGSVNFNRFTITARFVADEQGSLSDYSDALHDLIARRGVVCYRDPRGRRFFGVLRTLDEQDTALGTLREIELEFNEVNFSEGVV